MAGRLSVVPVDAWANAGTGGGATPSTFRALPTRHRPRAASVDWSLVLKTSALGVRVAVQGGCRGDLRGGGAKLKKCCMDAFWQGNFVQSICGIRENADGGNDLGASPSGDIARFVRAKLPVFMAERVLLEAGIVELDD